ncbi:hypothetical protein BDZ89DRAFT_1154138 [Hymenopellis radicata]|nr:hypothetical protein BDZ89DRAFT_1154138 [Hymenopellis radicata]
MSVTSNARPQRLSSFQFGQRYSVLYGRTGHIRFWDREICLVALYQVQAVLRNLHGGKKRFVEIRGRDGVLILTKDVTDDHGEFYADEYFGSLSFSSSENAIVLSGRDIEPTTPWR